MTVGLGFLWDAFAKLPFADRFEGARAVARREFAANLRSFRMIVVAAIMALAIVGGSAGISALAGGGGGIDTTNVFFAHATSPPVNGSYALSVFASDVFGAPHADYTVVLAVPEDTGGFGGGPGGFQVTYTPVANATTSASGFVRFSNLSGQTYAIGYTARRGGFVAVDFINPSQAEVGAPFSLVTHQYDLGQNGSNGHFALHATTFDGAAIGGAQVTLDGAPIATLDGNGFVKVILQPGAHNVSLVSGNASVTRRVVVREPAPTALQQGTDFILLIVATAFVPFLVPIATIAIAHDAIAREKANGSIDFILSRPATRRGMLLGKFFGSTSALLVPIYITLVLGALVIGALGGTGVSGGFLGVILLGVTIYVASYGLLVLMLSTIAKTTGTAIMFGVLLWLLYSVLWNIVIFLVTAAAGMTVASPGYASLVAYTGLFNLNDLYSSVVSAAYTGSAGIAGIAVGGGVLPDWAPLVTAIVWFGALLFLAFEVFERKAAE